MPRTVDYYFSLVSPWAYIGHAPFTAVAERHGVRVNHKPMMLGQVFAKTGGQPLAQRHPARQRYRMLELQRWRVKRGLAFNLQPRHWPFDATLADRFVIAALTTHQDPEPFMRRAFAAIWEEERDLADEATIAALAAEAGLDPKPLLAAAENAAAEAIYAVNLENAVDAGIFGSPAYVLEGEVFWGQDRIELLDDALASGRAPFLS